MDALRTSEEYQNGVEEFIEFAKRNVASKNGKYPCPCVKCVNVDRKSLDSIRNDLICEGINRRYRKWIWHGELGTTVEHVKAAEVDDNDDDEYVCDVGMDNMINDIAAESFVVSDEYDKVRGDAETPLFPGCKKYSRLTFILTILEIKTENGWADAGFSKMLAALSDMFPDNNAVPKTMYEAKKMLSKMGMEYQKIHACPNDCILYRNEYEGLHVCPRCQEPRYKQRKGADDDDDDEETNKPKKGEPSKVMWYLPIVPRFRRLFANATEAENLRWYCDQRNSDSRYLRHPADSPQWKKVDSVFPEFASDPRNLRLGLCTDGFNPFGSVSSKHSAWPVLLVIYNLPPWLCTKRKYLMMCMMISGPKQPGNDIDVYLAPLIEDLKMLWNEGVDVFDAYKKETFKLRALLFTTINDLPAYDNLSGYSVKGHKACPICEDDTNFVQLKYGRKTVYLGHRRFLDRHHPYRRLRKRFNGFPEHASAPIPLTGEEVYRRVARVTVEFGKGKKKKKWTNIWKKRSIFFDLPYWRCLDVRHSIDVMHVEKNLAESIVGTLLHIQGKTKDGLNARRDLVEMGIRQRLHPTISVDGKKAYMEPAAHTLSKLEKTRLCECLRGMKVPHGYSSNISKLVSMDDLKLTGMKSHDYHVLMQQLLPVAIRGILEDDARKTLTRLCKFLNAICSKVIDNEILDELEKEGYVILSQLEMHFPPAFFDISVHLIVHLVREIRLCGPVSLRWMYPFEQFMKVLKGYSKNPYRPEASIVKRYLVEEAMDFCKPYLRKPDDEEINLDEDELSGKGVRGMKVKGVERVELLQAHLYILNNMKEVQPYLAEHKRLLKENNPKKSDMQISNEHNKSFIGWFEEYARKQKDVSDTVRLLAVKPQFIVFSWGGYEINGYSFSTKVIDGKRTTQNSGVMVEAEATHFSSSRDKNPKLATTTYYGVIEEIWEIIYAPHFKVPIFKCKWVHSNAVVIERQSGMISVDLNRVGYKDEPFILASHAKQVFYVSDPTNVKLSIALQNRNQMDCALTVNDGDDDEIQLLGKTTRSLLDDDDDDDFCAVRNDHTEGIWDIWDDNT